MSNKIRAEKYCYACKQILPVSCFGKNKNKKDGLSTECKTCKKISDSKSHKKNRDKRLAKMKVYRENHLDELNDKARQYARSNRGRDINNKATRKYYKTHRKQVLEKCKQRNISNPDKYIAEYTASNAVKLGKLIRPEFCSKCNNSGVIEAHHPDYSKPLMVEWLCKKCHGKVHRKVR